MACAEDNPAMNIRHGTIRRESQHRIEQRTSVLRYGFDKLRILFELGFPFSVGPYPTKVARFRAIARRATFARHGALRIPAKLAMTFVWPVGALFRSLATLAQMKKRGVDPCGWRVFVGMYWLALRYSVPPLEYAVFRLGQPQRRANVHEYVYWNDLPALMSINARLGADNRDVQDKDRFAALCANHAFPHVPTLAVFERGRQTCPERPFAPDAPALWSKALRLKGGAGGAKWTREGGTYRKADGRIVSVPELVAELRGQDCIVQPFIENHSDIAKISNGALAPLRIVTGMDAAGKALFITSMLCLPRGAHDSSIGGILCSIDRGTGRLRKAATPDNSPVSRHPDTGVPIAGITIPFWSESISLVERAHAAAFPRFAFLGWDVAISQDGPVLLETNSGWGAIFHQMLDGPLGHTEFSRLVGQYV
jgi:hypothetical protein